MSTQPYVTLDELINVAEDIQEVESADFSEFELISPGWNYLSKSRDIMPKVQDANGSGLKRFQKPDGSIVFKVAFSNGLETPEGRTTGRRLVTYISTKKYQQGDKPGQTSQVGEYLRNVGINAKGLSGEALLSAIAESANLPVYVGIGWEERAERNTDGSYPKTKLRTQNFNLGTKDQPNYTPTVTINGTTFEARHKVAGFKKVQ
jgi:hypothetical protein